MIKVKFWGVRGSIPVPGPETLKFGGNTSCVEVDCGGEIIIIDGGTGLRPLGQDMMANGFGSGKNKKLCIFFSHVHWDHIQGFPFFKPAFIAGAEVYLYGLKHSDTDIETALRGQMISPHFPIRLRDMPSRISFKELKADESVRVGEAVIRNVELNHPNRAFGYRVDFNGKSVAYICDHEHSDESEDRIAKFSKGVDLLIFDSQYTPEEYSGADGGGGRKGWGHSTWEMGVELVKETAAKRLALFHHGRDDVKVEEIESNAKKRFPGTVAAYEGLEICL
ncbi:MAG: MBL fold metallo-hydrolase [Nitrospinae bacterium]|nr:MBL fold metallo-hydrolase [Nitrospinota bacterium]